MGCFNCFKSKVEEESVEPNKLRENPSAPTANEKIAGKLLAPKTSNEPSVEEVEHSRDRTQEFHANESRATSAIITRDFGAFTTDPARSSTHSSSTRTSQAADSLSQNSRKENNAATVPELSPGLSEGTRPPRSTSLGSRRKSRSQSRSSKPKDPPSVNPSPSKESHPKESSATPTNQQVTEIQATASVAQDPTSTITSTAVKQLHDTAEESPVSPIKATEVASGNKSLVKEASGDARSLPKVNSTQSTTEKEGVISDDKTAAEIPLPASPSSSTSPTLPSLSTSVPSVSDKKSPSTSSPSAMDDSHIRRSSQHSNSYAPTDFLAENEKPKDASPIVTASTQAPQKLASPKSPPLVIPQAQSSSQPIQQNIPMDAPTPTSASSATRPDNLLRTSTAPSGTPPSPNTKADKRKTRLSRFLSTGGVNKRKPQALPVAKDVKTMEDMPPTPKYIPTAVPSEKKQVRDVDFDEKQMQQKEVELETPATVDSVTGRTWKDDGDNDSLFCY